MINRIFKIINNKFPRLLKFIFFLRYLFLIFLFSLSIFLLIPNFFDFKKREEVIKTYLLQNYKIDVGKINNIKYKYFPLPHLEVSDLDANLFSQEIPLKTKQLFIYPKFTTIYNFENLVLE